MLRSRTIQILAAVFLPPLALLAQEHLKIPAQGAYAGAYVDWGDTEDSVSMERILAFEKLAGKQQAIIAFSSYWGTGKFPTAQAEIVRTYGAAPLIYWSPWGPPYEQNKAQPDYALDRILEGKFDSYIRDWAHQARDTHTVLLVAWGLEMNGDWFPWGGAGQGGGETKKFGDPKKPDGPEKFVAAYRYVVDHVRQAGARNIEWIFHAQNYSWPVKDWNRMANYYPGDDYVDWLGMSVYGKQYARGDWLKFDTVMRKPCAELAALNKTKPIILAEWGVAEFPRSGSKAEFFDGAFASMKKDYPRLKAIVYWHERWQNDDEIYSNLRINSSPNALKAYQRGLADPWWLGRPEWKK